MPQDRVCKIDYDFSKGVLTIYIRAHKTVKNQEVSQVDAFDIMAGDQQFVDAVREIGVYNPDAP